MSAIAIVDYGLGNLGSVSRALRWLGQEPLVTDRPEDIRAAGYLILPGDGAFGYGMQQLRDRDLLPVVRDFIDSGKPFLGICVGMQLLLTESEEFGRHAGLGVIPGRVVPFPAEARARVKVPHIGWSPLSVPSTGTVAPWRDTVLRDVAQGDSVYFVHSFLALPDDPRHRVADSPYGGEDVCAVISRDNVVGCQFHPEKSGPVGLRILRAFLEAGRRGTAIPAQGVSTP